MRSQPSRVVKAHMVRMRRRNRAKESFNHVNGA
jgi:hypothetical protein